MADAFDAMISERLYRRSLSSEDALKELERCAGSQFDPGIVNVFIKAIKRRKLTGYRYPLKPMNRKFKLIV